MRLEPFYTATFTTPEAWSVEVQPRHREQQDDKDAILLSQNTGEPLKRGARFKERLVMAGFVEGIFLAPEGGAQMKGVEVSNALEGCGLEGDRYCAGTGHWSRFGRVCEVTFMAAEDLDDIEQETGVRVKNGEHRRNVVTRGISLKTLHRGERFRVGEVVFEYQGPHSVCRYIERLTEPGMRRALKDRGGICATVTKTGTVRVGDEIEVL